ncbi:hypothetical protein WOLCODRAFT_151425 [Wolfiporia cocos MD-104 SS10]|uniref:Uncharacterized protein n=1 Tax=Wolfiporia cocos (strain MD-104) TaxID=742152 RepID=A0A2H3JHM2_WOLCO|nr:hypothetical protein WOLCODRAFT_151425 [Wolfiporia cocos MD-104 SS10]
MDPTTPAKPADQYNSKENVTSNGDLNEQGANVAPSDTSYQGTGRPSTDSATRASSGEQGPDGTQVVVTQAPQPTFKEKVVGYAKEVRGTVLGKPETKQHGERILKGEESFP